MQVLVYYIKNQLTSLSADVQTIGYSAIYRWKEELKHMCKHRKAEQQTGGAFFCNKKAGH